MFITKEDKEEEVRICSPSFHPLLSYFNQLTVSRALFSCSLQQYCKYPQHNDCSARHEERGHRSWSG